MQEFVQVIVLDMELVSMVFVFAKRVGAEYSVRLVVAQKHVRIMGSANMGNANAKKASGVMTVQKSFVQDHAPAMALVKKD